MSGDQEILNLAGTESETQTLFDELAGLVPPERQAEYYRVIAHTRTLSPNDEVLRVLEAMGILALLTRETPVTIAVERKSLQKILENALSKAKSSSEWQRTHHGLSHGLRNYRRKYRRVWIHLELRGCWERVCGNVSSNTVCRRTPECLASLVLKCRPPKGGL